MVQSPLLRRLFDGFELRAMRFFARVWHSCRPQRGPLPRTGPLIVVSNHPSHADPAFLLACSPRPLHFLQARECYEVPLLRHLFRLVGCIPVARDGRDVAGTREALRHLRAGAALAVFPEGEVTPGPFDPAQPAHRGAALLALRSRAAVYPVLIEGGPQRRPLVWSWLWPSRGVRVTIGGPVDLARYHSRPINHQVLGEVTALLMDRIAALGPQPAPLPASRFRPVSTAEA